MPPCDGGTQRVGLLNSEERLRAFVEALPDMAFVLDADGCYLDALTSHTPLLHAAEGQLKGRYMHDVFPKVQADRFVELIRRTIETGLPQVVEYELATMGGVRWFEGRTSPLRTAEPNDQLVVWVSRDVTKRVESDQALRKSEERFRRVFEASPLGMCLMDSELRLGVVNARTCEMLGYSPHELVGVSLADLCPVQDRRAALHHATALFTGETHRFQLEQRLLRRDGIGVWVSITASLLHPAGAGEPVGLGMLQDVTARREAEEQVHELTRQLEQRVEQRTSLLEIANVELARAKDAAEQASQTKSLFLANMSHEIRTPLNAILGYAQLLQRSSEVAPPAREHATAIARSGEHLLNIIDDVLEMSKIEAGRVALNPVEFSLSEMLSDLERMFRMRAETKQLELSVELGAEVPRFVTADEGKLRQILVNLLGNAVKFTQAGRVVVRVAATPREKRVSMLIIDVEDSGVGIADEEAAQVFAPFEQTAVGRAHKGGTGLGVPISREFAEMMGGSLTFTSTVGEGTTFHLRIPVSVEAVRERRSNRAPQRPVVLLPDAMGTRVLVVDDVAENRAVLRSLLSSVGFDVREAASAVEAERVLMVFLPQVVVAELHLPDSGDGAIVRTLRARYRDVAVVAVSVGADEQDHHRAMALGADAYLRKPLRDEDLLEVVGMLARVGFDYSPSPDPISTVPVLDLPEPDGALMATLPPDLRADMKEATTNGDLDQLMQLINGAQTVDEGVAEHLRSLAVSYEYEKLDALLKLDD